MAKTIQLTLDGQPLLNSADEAANLALLNRPQPDGFALANSLINPLGREPARGRLLLSRAALNAINLDGLHTLVMVDPLGNRVSVGGLVIIKEPVNITASNVANDVKSAYLVDVADARWRVRNPHYSVVINHQFNVRAPAYAAAGDATAYYAGSLNTGTAWTWLGMVQTIWTTMATQLGTAPASLPFTPDGTPESWIFPGVPAWDSLCDVLDRIGCAVVWNATTGLYSIVRVGVADAAGDAIIAAAAPRRIDDAECLTVVRGKIPSNVVVYFRRVRQWGGSEESATNTSSQWASTPLVAVTVNGTAANTEANTSAVIFDDLPALYDSTGAAMNSSAISTRAAERAADYYRQMTGAGGGRFRRLFSGLVNIAPGATVKGVAWRQDGGGAIVTEVVRAPALPSGFPHAPGPGRVSPSLPGPQGCDSSASISAQQPRFGPTWPVWPPLMQTIKVNTAAPITGSTTMTQTFTTPGSFTWTAPTGVTSVTAQVWGSGGGGGGSGSGGGGGAYSTGAVSVTAGTTYNGVVGAGGAGGSAAGNGSDGNSSWFASTTSVLANGGKKGVTGDTVAGGQGGTTSGAFGTTKFSGGSGGYRDPNGYTDGAGGGEGGSSAGTASNGTSGSGSELTDGDYSGPVGAVAPTGGGNGGNGGHGSPGPNVTTAGSVGQQPGGGGGGGGCDEFNDFGKAGGAGAAGQVVLSWLAPTSLFDCFVERCDDPAAPTWTDREACYGLDKAGAFGLDVGSRYDARLVAYYNGRPVYAFRSGWAGVSSSPSTSPSSITATAVQLVAGPPTWTPVANTYPVVWNPVDGLSYSWNGNIWLIDGSGFDWTCHYDIGTSFGSTSRGTSGKRWHMAGCHTGAEIGSETMAMATMYAVPFIAPAGATVSALGVGLLVDINKKLLIGIYQEKGNGDKYPGALLYPSGGTGEINLNGLAAGGPIVVVKTGVATTLQPKVLYWLVIYSDGQPTIQFFDASAANGLENDVIGWGDGGSGGTAFTSTPGVGLLKARTYDSTLPATFPSGATILGGTGGGDHVPAIGVQF